MDVLLVLIAEVIFAGATYYLGLRRGRAQGRSAGFIDGHTHALDVTSHAIEAGVFRLATRILEGGGGRHSPTLQRFLVAFTRGDHLK